MDRERLASDPVLDAPSALERLGGDADLLADLIGFFIEDAPQLLERLQAAIKNEDAEAARKAAHALKGLILGCGGVRAARAAQAVEDASHAADWENIGPQAEKLGNELETLIDATLSYRGRRATPPAPRAAQTEFLRPPARDFRR